MLEYWIIFIFIIFIRLFGIENILSTIQCVVNLCYFMVAECSLNGPRDDSIPAIDL